MIFAAYSSPVAFLISKSASFLDLLGLKWVYPLKGYGWRFIWHYMGMILVFKRYMSHIIWVLQRDITFTQRLTVENAPFPNSSFRSYSSLKWPLLDIATPK